MFAGMDANGDGNVTAAEMDAYQASRPHKSGKHATMTSAEKIRAIDTNGDGRISAAEHEAGSQKMFARMDTNGDGHLTAAEMKAGHETLMKPDAAAGDGPRREFCELSTDARLSAIIPPGRSATSCPLSPGRYAFVMRQVARDVPSADPMLGAKGTITVER